MDLLVSGVVERGNVEEPPELTIGTRQVIVHEPKDAVALQVVPIVVFFCRGRIKRKTRLRVEQQLSGKRLLPLVEPTQADRSSHGATNRVTSASHAIRVDATTAAAIGVQPVNHGAVLIQLCGISKL